MSCIFCRIVAGEIAAKVAYQDDQVMAFHDLDPKAPIHVLIIPKAHLSSLAEATAEHTGVLGQALVVAPRIAKELGIAAGGFRVVINAGADAGQSVDHLHVHLLGGRRLGWPPG